MNEKGLLHKRGGFTLVELLVVIGIIAVLVSLLLPAVQKVREAANNTTCKNNLKQLGLSVQTYNDVNGTFPTVAPDIITPNARAIVQSFLVVLLPYVEQQNLYDAYVAFVTTSGSGGFSMPGSSPLVFACPSDAGNPSPAPVLDTTSGLHCGITSYRGNESSGLASGADDGVIVYNSPGIPILSIIDGASNTILIGEGSNYDPNWSTAVAGLCNVGYGNWSTVGPGVAFPTVANYLGTDPINFALPASATIIDYIKRRCYGSGHPNGANFVFCDASVRFITNAINNNVLTLGALCSRAGGDVIPADAF